jgi:hypothetical protein
MKRKPNSLHSLLHPFWIVGLIALVAIAFQYDGLIRIKVGKEGGSLLIDGRAPSEVVKSTPHR